MTYESARSISNFLPIEAGGEQEYIDHLWGAFETLIEKDEPVRAFAILPFHLLFMFSVQYKVHRLSAYDPESYRKTLGTCRFKDPGDEEVLLMNPPIPDENGIVSADCSVRNLSFIDEKKLFDFFNIIKIDRNLVDKAVELIKIRGSYAHANGNIEDNIEQRIDEYLDVLVEIENKICPLNDDLATEWMAELEPEDDKNEFVEIRLAASYLCLADFETGLLAKHFPRS